MKNNIEAPVAPHKTRSVEKSQGFFENTRLAVSLAGRLAEVLIAMATVKISPTPRQNTVRDTR